MDLATLRFIEKQENILFVGSSGVGKTHLATSIGMECASQRYSTYFISSQDLMKRTLQRETTAETAGMGTTTKR